MTKTPLVHGRSLIACPHPVRPTLEYSTRRGKKSTHAMTGGVQKRRHSHAAPPASNTQPTQQLCIGRLPVEHACTVRYEYCTPSQTSSLVATTTPAPSSSPNHHHTSPCLGKATSTTNSSARNPSLKPPSSDVKVEYGLRQLDSTSLHRSRRL